MKKEILILLIICLFSIGCNKKDNDENDLVQPVLINGKMITAAFNLQGVESFAKSHSADLKLRAIESDDVDFKGFSEKWCFEYTSIGDDYYYHTTHISIGLDSTSSIKKVGSRIISHQWINSNEVLPIAENNGGKEFRIKNKDYRIKAVLSEPLVPNSKTFWYITYYSVSDKSKRLNISIDATTGEIN